MHYFRRLLRNNKLGSLLLAGIVLRSLVATGYMLDTEPADGSLLSIRLCDGPVAIQQQANHDHHQHHHADETHDAHAQHDQGEQSHVFSACSFWSSSSQLLLVSFSLDHLLEGPRHAAVIRHTVAANSHTYNRTPFPRAPPALS